ncbi:hypothetical protein EXIGLDRAFT_764518 [Exidia glandulosa HHB12029]|uniref:Membrane-associated proteins in eicosanoid and glutathione metabolism n=1 Tax=Exidia glandulosa HHB12029 TaxID=1314781 RepID=A0A165L5W3_EXIGL|nr:hypothetical protein EXIGLDRAFT_764518 [Exidia glandulosa HHB12029]
MAALLSTPGLSLYSIPAAWVSLWLPINQRFAMILFKTQAGYNNVIPRTNAERLQNDPTVPKDFVETCAKLEGAHKNGLETFPLWVAAVLAGNFAGVETETLNKASAAFVFSRFLYNYIYVNSSTNAQGYTRTGTWATSIGICMYVLVKAGNKLRLKA